MSKIYWETGSNMSQDNYKENMRLLTSFRNQFKRGYNSMADILIVYNSRSDKDMIQHFKDQGKLVVYANHMQEFRDEHPEYFL